MHKFNQFDKYVNFLAREPGAQDPPAPMIKVLDIDLQTINNPKINFEVIDCTEPLPISPISSLGYELIEHTTMQLYPDTIVIPGFKDY